MKNKHFRIAVMNPVTPRCYSSSTEAIRDSITHSSIIQLDVVENNETASKLVDKIRMFEKHNYKIQEIIAPVKEYLELCAYFSHENYFDYISIFYGYMIRPSTTNDFVFILERNDSLRYYLNKFDKE